MICGIGIDIIEVERIRNVHDRHGQRFLKRIYSAAEIESVHGTPGQYWASRFAAKEAAFKALGTGWNQGVRWVDVEVSNLPSGQPVLHLSGQAKTRADELGADTYHLSITHTAAYAAAQVVLERRQNS